MSAITTEQKQAWDNHIQAQQKSGLSRRQYCRQENLLYHKFQYYWKQHRQQQKIQKKFSKEETAFFTPLLLKSSALIL